MRDASPLRYPGGKWRVASFFERIISSNCLENCHYIEPYAGGASLALSLLFKGCVAEIHLNDLDAAVHAFWHCVLKRNREFLQLLRETPVTPDEWKRQKTIYATGTATGRLALGFATFFLNRTNHSGILNGGMIGGKKQDGVWKLDARFNRTDLERRIKRIHAFRTRIHLSKQDAVEFLLGHDLPAHSLVYLDPPYCRAGKDLYLNAYLPNDHAAVRRSVGLLTTPWIVSYDDVPEIRHLYSGVRSRSIRLLHTARSARPGREILFFAPSLRVPRDFP
jgi:DNA adenine methylase